MIRKIRICYNDMIRRCYNKKSKKYADYGGRGITVCKEWLDNKYSFYMWSLNNGFDDDLSLYRIDNNKGYSPENCRWTDWSTQMRNKRISKNNKSGYKGVYLHKASGLWYARIYVNKQRISLAYKKTAKEAYDSRIKYIKEHKLDFKD